MPRNGHGDVHSDLLSWGDTVFLNLERDGMPLNVACICILEGEVPFQDFLQFIASKLPSIPRYLKHLVASPLNIGLPSWEYDPDFDIRYHVREAALKRGSDTELKTLAGKILGTVMDRRRPLWDFTLVHGLKGSRSAVIIRLHHCLADGIAGISLMNVLMDASPVAPPLPKRKLRLRVPPPRDVLTSLADGCVRSYSDFVKLILSALSDVSSMVERFASTIGSPATDEFTHLLPELSAPTERLRFNTLYRGPQQFTYTEIPLADIKAIRQNCGTSLNDVILALVTSTIRRYLLLHGDHLKGRLFRMMIPVNLRACTSTNTNELGNRISLVPVSIPLDIRSPRLLLAAVHERTNFLKRVHAAELVSLAGGLISMFPNSAQSLCGQILNRLPITFFNMVCTNVPGPQYPLYLLGHKILHCYPYVPVGGEMTLNCAILTYNNTAYFGFTGEVHAVPDLRLLEKLLKASFSELREAAGVKVVRTVNKPIIKRVRMKKVTSTHALAPALNPPAVPTEQAVTPAESEIAPASRDTEDTEKEVLAELIA
jgi:diacylglycerol O-acyltransferase